MIFNEKFAIKSCTRLKIYCIIEHPAITTRSEFIHPLNVFVFRRLHSVKLGYCRRNRTNISIGIYVNKNRFPKIYLYAKLVIGIGSPFYGFCNRWKKAHDGRSTRRHFFCTSREIVPHSRANILRC